MSPCFTPTIPSPQPRPASQTLFPINLRATRPAALLSSHQLRLLSDLIPARTKVRVENCSAHALLDVYLSEEALTTAEFTAFLNYLTLSAVPHSVLPRGPYPPRPRGCAPTVADVLLLGHTILWTLHSDMHNVWTATVDVPRPAMY
uniref:Uncharacterized protein n=1 Tax=Mycena chlorophos TaxID=658473 RepID=A0ABQ0L247_MYCCL|nr:predicted protein [Mycena chlorophos]